MGKQQNNLQRAWDKMLVDMHDVLEKWENGREAQEYPQHVPSFDELFFALTGVTFERQRTEIGDVVLYKYEDSWYGIFKGDYSPGMLLCAPLYADDRVPSTDEEWGEVDERSFDGVEWTKEKHDEIRAEIIQMETIHDYS